MSFKIVPLTSDPHQVFSCTLPIDGKNKTLKFEFRYNDLAECWVMTIKDSKTDEYILDSVPIVMGEYPAANLLEQYKYLEIGSAIIVKSGTDEVGRPLEKNFGIEYYLVWGDTIG